MGETLPIVMPVRYSGGGLTMQTTTSRISVDGVFVRGIVTPKENSVVALQLTLPGGLKPVDARGAVIERVMPGVQGKEPGFWVRFDVMSEEGRAALEALVRERTEAGAPVKRTFPRAPAFLKVSWESPRDFLVAYSENISAGGIFVATQQPPPLGAVVELTLELPDGEAPAKTKAQVIQRITPDQAIGLGRHAGAGLQFIDGDDAFRARLDKCIDNLLKA